MGSIVWPPTWGERGEQGGMSHLHTIFPLSEEKVLEFIDFN